MIDDHIRGYDENKWHALKAYLRFGLGLYSFGVANMNHNVSKILLAALGYSQPDKKSQSGNLIDNHCCC